MMLETTSGEEVISDVTLANDDDQHRTALTFQYNLNKVKTKKLLIEGARRETYIRGDKTDCIILLFNDGAYNEVVLKALVELQNGPKHFIVGKEQVERISIDQRKELSGLHVDTKIEFQVKGGKILMHAYNTKQKLMIQGKKYKWLVENYLEPFLKVRILKCQPQIEEINQSIISNLNSKKTYSANTESLDEEAEILTCDKCTFATPIADYLNTKLTFFMDSMCRELKE